jgi:hypothetical protein
MTVMLALLMLLVCILIIVKEVFTNVVGTSSSTSVSCAAFSDTPEQEAVNIGVFGTFNPNVVAVDNGQWIFYADSGQSNITRYRSKQAALLHESGLSADMITNSSTGSEYIYQSIGHSAGLKSISGLCVSPFDHSLYAVDHTLGFIIRVGCAQVVISHESSATYCGIYDDNATVIFDAVFQPSQCAVDTGGNIFLTQGSNLILRIKSDGSVVTGIPVSGSISLSAITIDSETMDLYLADASRPVLWQLSCDEVDSTTGSCLQYSETPTSPIVKLDNFTAATGLALNGHPSSSVFQLIITDGVEHMIIAINNPHLADNATTAVLAHLPHAQTPSDIALDPFSFDAIIAQPMITGQGGFVSRLYCSHVWIDQVKITTEYGQTGAQLVRTSATPLSLLSTSNSTKKSFTTTKRQGPRNYKYTTPRMEDNDILDISNNSTTHVTSGTLWTIIGIGGGLVVAMIIFAIVASNIRRKRIQSRRRRARTRSNNSIKLKRALPMVEVTVPDEQGNMLKVMRLLLQSQLVQWSDIKKLAQVVHDYRMSFGDSSTHTHDENKDQHPTLTDAFEFLESAAGEYRLLMDGASKMQDFHKGDLYRERVEVIAMALPQEAHGLSMVDVDVDHHDQDSLSSESEDASNSSKSLILN